MQSIDSFKTINFSTYAKYFEKLTFLPSWYIHIRRRVRDVSFSENFEVLRKEWWSSYQCSPLLLSSIPVAYLETCQLFTMLPFRKNSERHLVVYYFRKYLHQSFLTGSSDHTSRLHCSSWSETSGFESIFWFGYDLLFRIIPLNLFLPSENTRKPKVFLVFSGGIKWEHWPEIGSFSIQVAKENLSHFLTHPFYFT